MHIDQDERRHSHLYELKPMSRWFLIVILALSSLGVYANGWDNPVTWFLLLMGWGLGLATLLTNPQKWLSKR